MKIILSTLIFGFCQFIFGQNKEYLTPQIPEIKYDSLGINPLDSSLMVVIDVCVYGSGKVISARNNEHKSLCKDQRLIELAIKNAKNWTFNPSQGCL